MNELMRSELVGRRTAESFAYLDVVGIQLHGHPVRDWTASCFPHRVIVGSETFPNQIDTTVAARARATRT